VVGFNRTCFGARPADDRRQSFIAPGQLMEMSR
jgi:hypothetical protein